MSWLSIVVILAGEPLPKGWSGKLWAVHQGIGQATRGPDPVEFVFLSDADVVHAPDTLRRPLYLGITLDSARRHRWGRGSRWEGRDYGRQEVTG